jgi:hypothetical protein
VFATELEFAVSEASDRTTLRYVTFVTGGTEMVEAIGMTGVGAFDG